MTVSIDKDARKRVSQESITAIARQNNQNRTWICLGLWGSVVVIVPGTIEDVFSIKGPGGNPMLITKKLSMWLNYTDPSGKRWRYTLTNVYLCNFIGTPLLSSAHLVEIGCKIHLTLQGHSIVFPNKNMSELTTQSNGLIALLPCPIKILQGRNDSTPDNTDKSCSED
jgi:hypothetical protein